MPLGCHARRIARPRGRREASISERLHINHTSGAQLSLGGIYGMPGPLEQISSYIRMQAGTLNVNASVQSFGGEVGHAPLANATVLQQILTLLVPALVGTPVPGLTPVQVTALEVLIEKLATTTSST